MVEHSLGWLRHTERLEEMASIARERELRTAVRREPRRPGASISIRRRIGDGLMRLGTRIAAGAGS